MKLLGGAWTPNIVWRPSGNPRRFSELREDIPRISAKVLTARLRALEQMGVVTRTVTASSPPSVALVSHSVPASSTPRRIGITRWAISARELIPVIESIVRVGCGWNG